MQFGQGARRAVFCLLSCAPGALACTPPSAVERAMSMERQGHSQDAIAILREDLQRHPEHEDSRRLLIRVLAFGGDLGAARAEADELARLRPEGDPIALIEIGHAYELAHQFDEALAAYDEAAMRAPASPAGPREGGMRAARWGEAEIALPRLEEAHRRGAHDTEMMHALGLVKLHEGDLDGAAADYQECADQDPKDTSCLLGLATVALKRDDFAAAAAAYDGVVARAPEHAAAHLGRAYAYARLGRKEDATRALDRAESLGAPKENVKKLRALVATPSAPSAPHE